MRLHSVVHCRSRQQLDRVYMNAMRAIGDVHSDGASFCGPGHYVLWQRKCQVEGCPLDTLGGSHADVFLSDCFTERKWAKDQEHVKLWGGLITQVKDRVRALEESAEVPF